MAVLDLPAPESPTDAAPVAVSTMDGFRGDRLYLGADHDRNERRVWAVAAICAATMAAQVAGGVGYRSMALVANGLHSGAHVAALLVAALAYGLARRHAADHRFSFGAGKFGYLAGFANGVVLAITALLIGLESLQRLLTPEAVDYPPAIGLAAAGLAVNLICVALLKPGRTRHAHDRDGDLNLGAAHLHLSADAVVSALAIAGLAAGWKLGWAWADPVAGLLGAGLVAQFAGSLIRRAGAVLLDMTPASGLIDEIRQRLEGPGDRVADLHVWRLGPGHHAAIVVIASTAPQSVENYRARLDDVPGLSHLTVEIRRLG